MPGSGLKAMQSNVIALVMKAETLPFSPDTTPAIHERSIAPMKNHYKILNIAELEQALISAGYNKSKSDLIKLKSSFESEDTFKARLQEIEKAYAVLSNKALKMDYDLALLQDEKKRASSLSQSPIEVTESSPADNTLELDWQLASEHFPQIAHEYERLAKFDHQLAQGYQMELHKRGLYKDSTAIKERLEKGYFQSIYGHNTPAKAYAKKLLLSNWRAPAEKFNASLRLLGHVVCIADLIIQIEKEFEFVKQAHNYTDFFEALKKDKCNAKSCKAFIESFFQIQVERHRFLFDQTFTFMLDDEEIFLHHADDLRGYLKTHFLNFKKRDVPENPFIMGR